MSFMAPHIKTPAPPAPIAPPQDEAAAQAAALRTREQEALARGRASTILGGGQGDLSPAPARKRTLLGEG